MCIGDREAELDCGCEYCVGWADGYNNGHIDGQNVPAHSRSKSPLKKVD